MKKQTGYKCHIDIYSGQKSKQEMMKAIVESRDPMNVEDAFFIGDLGDIVLKYRKWVETLPAIQPFYAVKCNDHPAVLKTLAKLGCNFDCASKLEMERILKLGVSPKRIVFANPVKQVSFIRYAAQHGVDLMTFDNKTELFKIKNHFPAARLVLRILPPSNFKVQCELGMKFGCPVTKTRSLLAVAKELDLDIVGVSFHVGSGCEDALAFEAAIREAMTVFNTALDMGFNVNLLDIGGGFPGQDSAPVPFLKIADVVKASLSTHLPTDRNVMVIAEPGRYFVASAFTLAVNVIAKRTVAREYYDDTVAADEAVSPTADDEPSFMYYVNDGVYGSFNCILYDHAAVYANVLQGGGEMLHTCSVWGPTCDGLDCVLKEVLLPELDIGDWLYFEDMGAYTMCAASTFNGMPRSRCHFHVQSDIWYDIQGGHHADTCARRKKKGISRYDEAVGKLASIKT